MTLTQLRSFIAVVQHGGFTAAARAMHSSQTTVTSQIQALEEEHGVELFHRRGRRVDLTATGNEFLRIARQIVDLEDDGRVLLEDSGSMRRGSLRIGAVSPFHVTEMIDKYHAQHPQMFLSMSLGNSEKVLHDLEHYLCDVGVIAKGLVDSRYHMQPYATYPVIVFVHREHQWAKRKAVTLDELSCEPLLVREPGSTTRLALEAALREQGLTATVAMEIGSREALREAVIRGLGVGTVSKSEYVPDERLVPLPIEGEPVVTHIQVCCLKERRRTQSVASFFDAISSGSLRA
jgi:aminoethylphosphonate catabolism LysR family transcriptional regulator